MLPALLLTSCLLSAAPRLEAEAGVRERLTVAELALAGAPGPLRLGVDHLQLALGPRYELGAPALEARATLVPEENLSVVVQASAGRSLSRPVAEAARLVHWSLHGERLDPARYTQLSLRIGLQWHPAPGLRLLLGVEQRRLWTADGKLPTLVRTSEGDALSAQATLRGLFTATAALLLDL